MTIESPTTTGGAVGLQRFVRAERPILFSTEMVRSILAGQKTQTRRTVKQQYQNAVGVMTRVPCPYGNPGDRLWVKETFSVPCDGALQWVYKADGVSHFGKWKPSIFMPRLFSRLLLEITFVRVERLQHIDEDDAEAEGALSGFEEHPEPPAATAQFRRIWEKINGRESWKSNPWVWVIGFNKI